MLSKTKIKIIVTILTIAVSLTGLLWIFSKKPSNVSSVQNLSGKQNQTAEDIRSENKQTRSLFATKSGNDVYKIRKDGKWVVVKDDQESVAYDNVTNPTFSLDGQKFAYSAYLDNQVYLVVNNNPQLVSCKKIISISFSPDGNRLAYVADNGNGSVVVLDGKAGKEYPEIGTLQAGTEKTYVVFSPDSQKIAYKVITENGSFIVVDQQAGKTYDDIIVFQFSNDSQQFAYQVENDNQQLTVVNNTKVITSNSSSDAAPSPTTSNTDTSSNQTSSTNSTNSTTSNRTYIPRPANEGDGEMSYLLGCSGSSGVSDCAP